MSKRRILGGLAMASVVAAGGLLAGDGGARQAEAVTATTVIFIGDMVCSTNDDNYNGGAGQNNKCQMKKTSDLAMPDSVRHVLTLGDNQYEIGALSQFQKAYSQSWGRPAIKAKTKATCGNHEYKTSGAQGFKDYFGKSCALFSLDVEGFRLVGIDTNKSLSSSSSQYSALKNAISGKPCSIVFGHHPRYSMGTHGANSDRMDAAFDLMYNNRVEAYVGGHDHNSQEYKPRMADGKVGSNGVRQFIAGAGGKNLYGFPDSINSYAVWRNNTKHAVLKMTLRSDRTYSWQFVEVGGSVLRSGSASCV